MCGAPTALAGAPYTRHAVGAGNHAGRRVKMHVLLDNVRSLYNVGSIFRTADAVGASRVHLCGITPTPGNPRLAKTALGAEELVPWTHHNNAVAAAQMLKAQGMQLWGIEGGAEAEPLFETAPMPDDAPIVLVVGNEISGVEPEVLAVCARTLYIPMRGRKRSLNVTVALGIAAYYLRYG